MNSIIKRSPLFYVGDKYKLMKQIANLFPKNINNFYEPFTGGGTVFLNTEANKYFLNDIDKHLINIHMYLNANAQNPDFFFKEVEKLIHEFGLSHSYQKDIIPRELKEEFKKTYYAKFNRTGYEKLRTSVNKNKQDDPLSLYLLLIYGFNRMLRFNRKGEFNIPVGNVDFNKNVQTALANYFDFTVDKKIELTKQDFRVFFKDKEYEQNDFIYLDPPYLITSSEYNKCWDEDSESALLHLIDELDQQKIKFALSNVTHYKGHKNDKLIKWIEKYNAHNIKSNYISYHDNGKKIIKEILVTNY